MRRLIDRRLTWGIMVTAVMFIGASSALGQDKGFQDGSKALQFRVMSDFSLSSFEGAAFSGKWHLSDSRALRLGLDLSGSFGTNTNDRYIERDHGYYTSHSWEIAETDSNYQSIDINTHYIFYMTPKKGIALYLGTGPSIGFASTKTESESNDSTFNDYEEGSGTDTSFVESYASKRNNKQWRLGISNIIGVEWFFSESMSFVAEYGVAIRYVWYKYSYDTNQPIVEPWMTSSSDSKVSSFDISPKSVNFGLSVYF
ncbi:MAG: hypothetical protein GY839_03365 [candidate division Zixibacteria bacterium]|nr:hypothetical protein [candidate division Zixibacteria bacterium]